LGPTEQERPKGTPMTGVIPHNLCLKLHKVEGMAQAISRRNSHVSISVISKLLKLFVAN